MLENLHPTNIKLHRSSITLLPYYRNPITGEVICCCYQVFTQKVSGCVAKVKIFSTTITANTLDNLFNNFKIYVHTVEDKGMITAD